MNSGWWIIIIISLIWEFFKSALAGGFPQKFEWQQVFSNLQNSSQYSGQTQHSCSLDGLDSACYFQVLQLLDQFFGVCTKSSNYFWYNWHFHVPQFFQFPSKVQVLGFSLLSINFNMFLAWTAKSTIRQVLVFLLTITRSGHLAEIWWSVCISKRRFYASHSPRQILGYAYTIFSHGQTSIFCTIPNELPCSPNHV